MIRITVEMLPKGDETKAYTLAQGIIANDRTGTENEGNYYYGFTGQVKHQNHDPGIYISGEYKGFSRKRENVWDLIKYCLSQGNKNLVPKGFAGDT